MHIRDRSIDGLRGLCALSVLLFHALQEISTAHGYDWTWHIPLAHTGVDIFFVISGYLMIESARRHHTADRFIWARFGACIPPSSYIQVLIFSLGCATDAKGLGDPAYFVERFIFDGLMLPGVFPIDPIQTVAWTLSFEAAFYLLVAGMRRQPECRQANGGLPQSSSRNETSAMSTTVNDLAIISTDARMKTYIKQ